MSQRKFCCGKLKDLHEIKGYMSGKETKIPALKDKKHLMCIMADNIYSTCPAYFEIDYCPCCGEFLT